MNRHHSKRCTFHQALLLALVLAIASCARVAKPPKSQDALPDNFGNPVSWLYRGAQPTPDQIRALAKMGVRTIVNLRDKPEAGEEGLVKELGLNYVSIPMIGSRTPPDQDVERWLAIIDDQTERPVFVHCAGGKHRTGIMVALYRVLREGMSADDAYAEMQNYHFGTGHPALHDYLYKRASERPVSSTSVASP